MKTCHIDSVRHLDQHECRRESSIEAFDRVVEQYAESLGWLWTGVSE